MYLNNILNWFVIRKYTKLDAQCSKVGHISYKMKWYNLPGKSALDLILIINMSRHPIQITAGRLISLSFVNFGNVSIIHYYIQNKNILNSKNENDLSK